MSSIPESLVAHHCGIQVLAFSLGNIFILYFFFRQYIHFLLSLWAIYSFYTFSLGYIFILYFLFRQYIHSLLSLQAIYSFFNFLFRQHIHFILSLQAIYSFFTFSLGNIFIFYFLFRQYIHSLLSLQANLQKKICSKTLFVYCVINFQTEKYILFNLYLTSPNFVKSFVYL